MLKKPLPTNSKDKIEVVEFFWYGCPHCYDLEKIIKPWRMDKKPADVKLEHVPAVFNETHGWVLLAKAYYAAEALLEKKDFEKFHTALFKAIHTDKQKALMHDEIALSEFFAKHGINEDDFEKNFDSFYVDMKIRHAMEMTKKYTFSGVPVIFVNGKYRLMGNYKDMPEVLDYLIEKERKLMKK